MSENEEIAAAIIRAKKGEESAYTLLLNTFWKDVYRFILMKTSNEDEAEDVTIRSFAKAFDKIDTFDEQYKFKSWILTIASNLLIDDLRKQKTQTISIHKENAEVYSITDEEPSPADQLIIEQNLAQLLAYIKQLKPHYQEIINLRFFQEMSYKEIADLTGEPMNNVKVKLLRAKKLLAEIIKNADA